MSPFSIFVTSFTTRSGGVARTIASSSSKLASGVVGGGLRKSGTYPSGGTSANIGPVSISSRRPVTSLIQGTWSAAVAGLQNARTENISSQTGEIAKRRRVRSATSNSNLII